MTAVRQADRTTPRSIDMLTVMPSNFSEIEIEFYFQAQKFEIVLFCCNIKRMD